MTAMDLSRRWALRVVCSAIVPHATASVLHGCDSVSQDVRETMQGKAKLAFVSLASHSHPNHGDGDRSVNRVGIMIESLMTETSRAAKVFLLQQSLNEVLTLDGGRPLPCVPAIVTLELLQVLYVWRIEVDTFRARQLLVESGGRLAWFRNVPWDQLLEGGWAALFACVHDCCNLMPSNPPSVRTGDSALFQLYEDMHGFDYRHCIRRFIGEVSFGAPLSCTGPRTYPRAHSWARHRKHGSFWPHLQFILLSTRQHLLCGTACQMATAFANVAQAVLLQHMAHKVARKPWIASDVRSFVQEAQRAVVRMEPALQERSVEPVARFCALHEQFPFLKLLIQAEPRVGYHIPLNLIAMPESPDVQRNLAPLAATRYGCSEEVAGDRYIDGWPPSQRLTAAGAFLAYQLIHTVGSLLDAFRIRWWAAHATLLGALRNGGLLQQECDVDIAVWRPDSHWLAEPALKLALAANSVTLVYLPLYFVFRFCASFALMEADPRSVDGGLSCRFPYIDAHLTDVAIGHADRWDYIYRSERRYAHSFPLAGIFCPDAYGMSDCRQRHSFGGYAEIWVPGESTSREYLAQTYGSDWETVLRQRDGKGRFGDIVYNDTGRLGTSFHGLFARPAGPLRNATVDLQSVRASNI